MSEEWLAISVLFFLGVIGCIFHVTILVLRFKLNSMKQNFYTFVATLAVVDILALLLFMFWCTSCILFSIPMDSYLKSNVPGFIMFVCGQFNEHILLLISISRFIAVFYPSKFLLIEDNHIKLALLCMFSISAIVSIPLLTPPCFLFFDYNMFVYHMGIDDCSWYFDKIVSLVYVPAVVLVSMSFNWATFSKVIERIMLLGDNLNRY